MTEKHPYAQLHAETQKKVVAFAEEYDIEEVEDRVWLRVDAILKAQSPDEAEKLAKRAVNVGLEFCIAMWSRKKAAVEKPKPQEPEKPVEIVKPTPTPKKVIRPTKQSA